MWTKTLYVSMKKTSSNLLSESEEEHFVKEKKASLNSIIFKEFWDSDTFEAMCTLKNSGLIPNYL